MKAKFFLGSIVLFCLFLVCPFFLSGEENVMTPEKIIRMNRIYGVQLSPDGRKVAYGFSSLDDEENMFT